MWLALVLGVMMFALGALAGAPYLPVRRPDIEPLLDLAGVRKGHTVVDLGSGDGRLLAAAARRGARAIGYEINPVLWMVSKLRTWPYRSRVEVYLANYWQVPLPKCDVLYVFLITHYMTRLEEKIQREHKGPLGLVSYIYQLPSRQADAQTRNAFLYKY